MLTWFQTSTQPGLVVGLPAGGAEPHQPKISESVPQRPPTPFDHQFSWVVRVMCERGRPNSNQTSSESVSGGHSSSPPKTVIDKRFSEMPKPSVMSSKPQRKDCWWL